MYEYHALDTRIIKHAMNQHFGSRFEIAVQNAYDSIVSFSYYFLFFFGSRCFFSGGFFHCVSLLKHFPLIQL